jgi:hypothetical protein
MHLMRNQKRVAEAWHDGSNGQCRHNPPFLAGFGVSSQVPKVTKDVPISDRPETAFLR